MKIVEFYRAFGFWRGNALIAACLVGISPWVLLHIWLAEQIGWPEAYSFKCSGCYVVELWHSPALLRTANGYELGLFAVLWSMPVIFVGSAGVILLQRYLKYRRGRIRPMDY